MVDKHNKDTLCERIKELHCLLNITKCFTLKDLALESLLKKVIAYIIPAWQFPERMNARIVYKKYDFKSANYINPTYKIVRDLTLNGSRVGFLEVGYAEFDKKNWDQIFYPEEESLLEAVGELVESMIEKKNAEIAVKKTTDKLLEQKTELRKKNIALKEILSQLELEKKEMQDDILLNVKTLVLPALHIIKNKNLQDKKWSAYYQVIEQNLNDLTSSLVKNAGNKKIKLSPREIEIGNLIKNGVHNKEISEMLNISVLTVERHRYNIRKKLDLTKSKVNLQSFLQQF